MRDILFSIITSWSILGIRVYLEESSCTAMPRDHQEHHLAIPVGTPEKYDYWNVITQKFYIEKAK